METSGNWMENLLALWGFKEETIQKFREQDISKDLLPYVDSNFLEDLHLSAGEKLRFKVHHKKYFDCGEKNDKTSEENPTATPPVEEGQLEGTGKILAFADEQSNVFVQQNSSCDPIVLNIKPNQVEDINKSINGIIIENASFEIDSSLIDISNTSVHSDVGHQSSSTTHFNPTRDSFSARTCATHPKLNLRDVLLQAVDGVILLDKYNKTKSLTPDEEDFIVARVIDYELHGHLDKQITGDRFIYLADEILKVFSKESRAIFIVVNQEGRFVSGKGKLYRRWTNIRRKLIACGLISRNRKVNKGEKRKHTEDVPPSPDCVNKLEVLKNISQPWDTVEECWKGTFEVRTEPLVNCELNIQEYMSQYPASKEDKSYLLFEIDFDKRHPGKNLNLYNHWPKLENFLFEKIFGVSGSKKKSSVTENLSLTAKTNRVIGNLSRIFNPVTVCKKSKDTDEWKPTRPEIQQSFFLHVKVLADLDAKIANRLRKLESFKCPLQPFGVLVGPTLDSITQTFVYISETRRYQVDTTLKGLDVLFKSFFALYARYPIECGQVWQFLQRSIWEIPYDPSQNLY